MSSQVGKEALVTVSPPIGLVYDAFDRGPIYSLIAHFVRYFKENLPEVRMSAYSSGVTINFSGDYPADTENYPSVVFMLLTTTARDDWLGAVQFSNERETILGQTMLTTIRAEIWGRTPAERDMVGGRLRRLLPAARIALRPKGVYNILPRYASPRGFDIAGTTWSRRDQAAQQVRLWRHIMDILIISEEGFSDPSGYDVGIIQSITVEEEGTGATFTIQMSTGTLGKAATITVGYDGSSDQESQIEVTT